jgi:AcrR family transcriptional regulator
VALHEEVGPAATTVMAVARRAGVQRLTVYRHFPDEAALLDGCSGHWREAHPLPDAAAWSGIPDATTRLLRALEEIYRYFAGGAPMLRTILRDESMVPALRPVMAPWHAWMREQVGVLSAGWGEGGERSRRVRAMVAVALRFHTWEALDGAGLDEKAAADVMAGAVRSAAESPAASQHIRRVARP